MKGAGCMKKNTMPIGYTVAWVIVAAAYLIWMLCMKNTILGTFETEAARTVDGVLYPDITGMTGRHWLYPVWVAISTLSLLLYPLYTRLLLFSEKTGKALRTVCLVLLVFDFIFVTWYAVMGDRYDFTQKLKYVTSSMIGLDFPWHFRMWGVFSSAAVFMNTLYAYRRTGFRSLTCYILLSIGAAGIYLTINLPSVGENADFSNPRCLFHWIGALFFAFLGSAPSGVLFHHQMCRGLKYYRGAFLLFFGTVVVMTALLVTVGKSALIENLPFWVMYGLLFAVNFTNLMSNDRYRKNYRPKKQDAPETAE